LVLKLTITIRLTANDDNNNNNMSTTFSPPNEAFTTPPKIVTSESMGRFDNYFSREADTTTRLNRIYGDFAELPFIWAGLVEEALKTPLTKIDVRALRKMMTAMNYLDDVQACELPPPAEFHRGGKTLVTQERVTSAIDAFFKALEQHEGLQKTWLKNNAFRLTGEAATMEETEQRVVRLFDRFESGAQTVKSHVEALEHGAEAIEYDDGWLIFEKLHSKPLFSLMRHLTSNTFQRNVKKGNLHAFDSIVECTEALKELWIPDGMDDPGTDDESRVDTPDNPDEEEEGSEENEADDDKDMQEESVAQAQAGMKPPKRLFHTKERFDPRVDKLFHCVRTSCKYVKRVPEKHHACLRFDGMFVDYITSKPNTALRSSNCWKAVNMHINKCAGKSKKPPIFGKSRKVVRYVFRDVSNR
jgi:hypothetical protein